MSNENTRITASMLYDLVSCPHRLSMDLFSKARKDDVSPFVQLLWDRGCIHEREVISNLKTPFVDLSPFNDEEKEALTAQAIKDGADLIYAGRISSGNLLGIPDLLRKEAGGYIAGDIKSGSGEEGGSEDDDGKPKKSYAVQLGLYTDVLDRMGVSAGRRAFIWDVHGREVTYDFEAMVGVKKPRRLWDDYQECLAEALAIAQGDIITLPAYSSICKNCGWYTACIGLLEQSNDLTLVFDLGRSKRDALVDAIPTLSDLANIDPEGFLIEKGRKTIFPGIGPDTLRKLKVRAQLSVSTDAKPFLREPISLPVAARELFFDIEVDPMRDVCYLHGFVERNGGNIEEEVFTGFFADTASQEAERTAFSDAWRFIKERQPCAIYYYSKYERTLYRKLQQKYPEVCTSEEIESLFASPTTVDLYYDVVYRATEWPTRDFSIKTLAKYLGFSWRDSHPSGAASIEWFDRWIKTGDPQVRTRILEYNEDDCRATRILLDGIRSLAI